jgi:hypothetical protein
MDVARWYEDTRLTSALKFGYVKALRYHRRLLTDIDASQVLSSNGIPLVWSWSGLAFGIDFINFKAMWLQAPRASLSLTWRALLSQERGPVLPSLDPWIGKEYGVLP